MSRFGLPLVLAAALFASACAGVPVATPSPTASPSPTATPTPGTTPTPVSSPSPSPDGSPSAVVVTFDVEGERFRIRVTDRDQISHVYDLLDGAEEGRIPNGLIVRGESGVNEGWSWSIDPDSLEFADMTMEVCDGLPSHVEDGTLAGDRYCPWGAVAVVAGEPAAAVPFPWPLRDDTNVSVRVARGKASCPPIADRRSAFPRFIPTGCPQCESQRDRSLWTMMGRT